MGGGSPGAVRPYLPTVGTSYDGRDGDDIKVRREVRTTVTFGDEQNQPWRTIQIWLELRHDLAAVALLQVGRKKGAALVAKQFTLVELGSDALASLFIG